MKKKLPIFTTDKEAEDFVDDADLTEYDLSELTLVCFEFQPGVLTTNRRNFRTKYSYL